MAATMKLILLRAVISCLLVATTAETIRCGESSASRHSQSARDILQVGVGTVDITPTEQVVLAGSPSPKKTSAVDTRLFVKAMVLAAGEQKVAIVTLDTLKYFTEDAVEARKHIEAKTHVPAGNVIISASHTHRGPLWTYYKDRLKEPIGKAVSLALSDLTPCKVGISRGIVEGVSKNRRVLKNGEAWNTWLLKPAERGRYPATGPVDPEVIVLAAVDEHGKYKALLYNYACHPTNTRKAAISADYPGDVQLHVDKHFGYEVPALFLPGACGDINPNFDHPRAVFGKKLAREIIGSLDNIEFVVEPTLRVESRATALPGRAHPEFNEREIIRKWPAQVEHYRRAFQAMKQRSKPAYRCLFSGIGIGEDFAIVTNPDELFCEIGLSIKKRSPFKHTMVAEQTNGARGYIPSAKAFELGGYETWYGEHSYLATRAAKMIERESVDILKQLENRKRTTEKLR